MAAEQSMPEAPLSVAYVITSTDIGGAERQVYELASTFRSRGWGVGVISMLPMHEQFLPLAEAGVRLASLEMKKGHADLRALVRLARLLAAWKPDVVHGHMFHANLLTRLARPLAPGTRVISTKHSQDEGHQWRYFAYRLTNPLAHVTTAVSQAAIDEAVRRRAARRGGLVLVPNGIRTATYERDARLREEVRSTLGLRDRFTWLSVGRLVEAKRHSDLLAAMRLVKLSAPNAHLLVAGSGPLRSSLERDISDAALARDVSLLGLRSDVRALMQAADGFVMSSAWEGLPMVLLEAAASSLPVVSTNVGGNSEAIVAGETGYLVPARQPAALADAMISLMKLPPDERRTMGVRARRHAIELYDLDRIADRWEELYRSG